MMNTNAYFTLDWMISGARYSGVPQRVQVLSTTFLANPKSVILRCPSWERGSTLLFHVHQCSIQTIGGSSRDEPFRNFLCRQENGGGGGVVIQAKGKNVIGKWEE
jgi:hypothetical protein